ncbi:MAG TPA: metal ABC transporter substrate-binding protein [Acidimicrobiales bacterium]|nr:metal ABC transporter substrate-binding protein [Acidimicrobiales bacterium]
MYDRPKTLGRPPRSPGRAARWRLAVCGAVAGLLVTACGGGHGAPRAVGRPVHQLQIVASAYPLAQLAQYLGGKYVQVTDLAPAVVQPQAMALSSRQATLVHHAGLVVVVGDGYQPAVEDAAAHARLHIALLPAVSAQALPYEFWLDPTLMGTAAKVLAASMSKADPAGANQFGNGARDMESVTSSLSSDLQSNLANCAKKDFVTEDGAFGRMAAAFGLHDVAISSAGASKAAALVRRQNLPVVFAEAGTGNGDVEQVAAMTGAGVKTLDPMEVAPPPGTRPMSYFAVMEEDLSYLQAGLSCDTSANFS